MKALSLKQPWAELVLQNRKTIELRRWNTKFRGKFLIHASGNIDEEQMRKFDFNGLPRQAIIGEAELIDVKKYKDEKEFFKDKDKHLASSMEWGRYGFVLKGVKRTEPIRCKGRLGFFDVDLSKTF